jgi:hypothetical protein
MLEIRRFRKKPVEIEAMRLIAGTDNYKDVCDWINTSNRDDLDMPGPTYNEDGSVNIPTLEGTMTASPGDWIIKGVEGEFYPCRASIFEATYEEA